MNSESSAAAPADQSSSAASPEVQTLAQDIVSAAALGKVLVADYKLNGTKGLLAHLPDVVAAVEKDFQDARAALPAIKAGYKTTEFWLVVAVVIGNGIYTVITGKVLPVNLNVVLGGLVAVYATARALIKKQTPAPPAA